MHYSTKTLKLPLFFLFLAVAWLSGCTEDTPAASADPFANCRYGAPKPIFDEGVNLVSRHDFTLEERQATEDVSFDGGLELSILQTGCDHIHQEFRFNLVDYYQGAPSSYWIQEAINKLYFLGQLGPAYVIYASIADALKERSAQLRLGQNIELQPGFYARIENGSLSSDGTLVVTLSEKPTESVASASSPN